MLVLSLVLLSVLLLQNLDAGLCGSLKRYRSVYEKIAEDNDMSSFREVLKGNRIARVDLRYKGVTVFVPLDSAFQRFNGIFDQELGYYHISYDVKSLKELATVDKIISSKEMFPPLWLYKQNDTLYVNNAKVVSDRSDYLGKTRDDVQDTGQVQILHVLDDVLDPIIRNTSVEPTASQLLSTPYHWQIKTHTLELFYERVVDSGLVPLFVQPGGHTFFIPVDEHVDQRRYNLLDNYTISAHVIPNQVLFTRPAQKDMYYETACNGDYIYILASFKKDSGKVRIKSTTVLGNSDHPKGELIVDIVYPNIPVKNGVVHLISRPLAVFDEELKPFPFLPISYKISSDPFLDYSYNIGKNTGLNDYLEDVGNKKITYFVPRNEAWKKVFEEKTFSIEKQREILGRHIVVGDTSFTMSRLLYLSRSSYDGSFKLASLSGEIKINVIFFHEEYFINFNDTFIRVYKTDYQCPDGVVHVLDAPFLYKNEIQPDYAEHKDEYEVEASPNSIEDTFSYSFWSYLKKILNLQS